MMDSPDTAAQSTSPLQFFGEELAENPFPMLTQIRTLGPLIPFSPFWAGSQQGWLVTRLSEAVNILKDKRFTVDRTQLHTDDASQAAHQYMASSDLFGQSMIAVDGSDHKRLRGLVSKVFTPKYIEGLRPRIQRIADDLLTSVQDRGQMDLVQDYAYPLPINVISDMLGVPPENRGSMRQWSEAIASMPFTTQNEETLPQLHAFISYIAELVAEKRRHPQSDLISQLVHLEEEGDRLNEAELLSMVGLLIFAGHETTSNLIGIGTLTLFDHPDQFAKLKANHSLIPLAVEELLRFNGPVMTPAPRFAVEDVEIGGQLIHRGDIIITILASVNRDESQFTDPEELDIARQINRHIAFGQGIHICLGAPLARLEGDIAFTTLLTRFPDLRLHCAREAVKWRGGFSLRGVESLPVAF